MRRPRRRGQWQRKFRDAGDGAVVISEGQKRPWTRVERTYPADLVSGEPLVCAATSDVSENLRAPDGFLELLAFASSRGVLPDGAALEGEGSGRELVGEALGRVEGGKKAFCISRPVDGTVLLHTSVRRRELIGLIGRHCDHIPDHHQR